MNIASTLVQGAYIVAGLLFILACPASRSTTPPAWAIGYGMSRYGDRPSRHHDPRRDRRVGNRRHAGGHESRLRRFHPAGDDRRCRPASPWVQAGRDDPDARNSLRCCQFRRVGGRARGWNSSHRRSLYPKCNDVEVFVGVSSAPDADRVTVAYPKALGQDEERERAADAAGPTSWSTSASSAPLS